MTKNKIINSIKIIYLGATLYGTRVLADAPTIKEGDLARGDRSIAEVLNNVITWVLGFAALIAVLFIIISGIRWIISSGNAEQAKSARSALVASVLGLIIIVLSYFIVQLVIGLPGWFNLR